MTARDPRFTFGLINDVFDVLERHGYRAGDNRHLGRSVGVLLNLASAYEQAGSDGPAIDSELWTCRGCGGPMIGHRTPDERCPQCRDGVS